MEERRLSASKPAKTIEPESKDSGLSIESLNETAGKLIIADSSLIVPESEITHLAAICSLL
jgi:hypothetical protein